MKISVNIKANLLLLIICSSMNLPAEPVLTNANVSAPQNAIPPNIVSTASKPMVMLTASKSHQFFGPAYNDFEDLDDDGVIDTTFKPTFKYYGYFDASKCYAYETNAGGRFVPAAMATQESVTGGTTTTTATRYKCSASASHWSGNFLNWAAMTRLDIVRKMLYGGYRAVDDTAVTGGGTVLMGAKMVMDSHSFVKYYNGTDIRDYTPFSQAALTKTTGSNKDQYAGLSICLTGTAGDYNEAQPVMRLVKGNYRFWSTVEWESCRWRDDTDFDPKGYAKGTFGPKLSRFYHDEDKGDGKIGDRRVYHEITIPWIKDKDDGASYSGIGPQLNVRVRVCDPALLGEERCQAFPPESTTHFKPYGLLQEFGYPKTATEAARVEFGLISGSYDNYNDNGNNPDKPDKIVGMAGALRKNMGDLGDEINRNTGVFCHNNPGTHSADSGCAATPPAPNVAAGIIRTFDAMVLYNYSRSWQGFKSNTAWLNPLGEMLVQTLQYYAYNGTTPTPSNPAVTATDLSVGMPVAPWINPFADSDARRAKYGNAICRPLNILAISSGTLSYDERAANPFASLPETDNGLDSFVNKIGQAEGIHGTARSVGSVPGNDDKSCSAKTVQRLSDVRGICPEAPALKGSYQIAGAALYGNTTRIRPLPSPSPAGFDKLENALTVKTMAVSLSGGAPRIDIPVPTRASGATHDPSTPLPLLSPRRYITITPENVGDGGNVYAPLSFVSISSGPRHGAFIVAWSNMLLGADYDMDIVGFIRYDLVYNPDNAATGWDVKVTTDIVNVCGAQRSTFGFSINGVKRKNAAGNLVDASGRYLTHQHGDRGSEEGPILAGMPPTSQYLCGDTAYRAKTVIGNTLSYAKTVCNVTGDGNTGDPDIPTAATFCTVKNADFLHSEKFHMVGEADALIKDPLWYVGKYGAFNSSVKNADGTYGTPLAMPPTQNNDSWDRVKMDGSIGQDGIPDGYFLGRRPELLEAYLRNALNVMAKNTNAVPAIAAAQVSSAEYKFVARFDSTTVTGELEAYKIDSATGEFKTTPEWKAGALLQARTDVANSRQIITNNRNSPSAGIKFRWDERLSRNYKYQMTTQGRNRLSETNAILALNYIRGDQSQEGPNGLRQRVGSLLGPVVNATPWVQGRPDSTLAGLRSDKDYVHFYKTHKDRAKLLWVAANDGMLHAFNPKTGDEVFAYVPGALANRLTEIPLQRGSNAAGRTKWAGKDFVTGAENHPPGGTIWPYVDGNPFSADVKVGPATDSSKCLAANTAWKTYVFGTLGRGGKGVFALDATCIADLTEDNAANVFKWQFTAADDPDLGYITGDVTIHPTSNQASPVAKMNNGKYALLLGNGYKSDSGKAVLFVLFVNGPDAPDVPGGFAGVRWTPGANGGYLKIVADTGPNNGLSMPRWEDIDGDGTADVAYAGDLKGNIWKFDLSNPTNPNLWQVDPQSGSIASAPGKASIGAIVSPLYNAGRPITTTPQLMHMGQGGLMVNFATGSAFDDADFPKLGVTQRVYGIWDRRSLAGAPSFARVKTVETNTLVRRAYTRSTEGVVTVAADTPALNWSNHNGWYMDLPDSGEAVLSDPSLSAGVLSFVTVRPRQAVAGESAPCFSNHRTALYTVDPISGKAERNIQGSITLNSTQVFVAARDISDQKVRSVIDRTKKAFARPPCPPGEPTCTPNTPICSAGQRAKRIIGSGADTMLCLSTTPRLQWREIPGLRTDD
ncbi:pilus assembly protein [Verminephrobacter eiseniae]|uniref:pilus assembly protein n=1 Tax=Verminephrobacter eiseniae TaxID=364317 RepID=UPI002237136E|nr:PilC/PilY family type IV pilus protein [Verminephrobacter eiseniae]MCW5231545.1 pilus assembly protein PilY [Verminephrobacter eiseniae]MCW5293274.1 pilus assembly protein PilY [Verminephrobacter eiseniae]MCW8225369.1 pilus assembly protein PilY [Verminephrobacter eiseniae]MCW8235985.1 pilus assembly protein PilY [Verminephrobacter eiseniae]